MLPVRARARQPSLVVAVVLSVLVALGACQPSSRAATGLILAVQTEGTAVTSFTLRTGAGEVLTFRVGQLELDGGAFAASHLSEHVATSEPVAAEYTLEDGVRVAHRLVDAAGPRSSP